MSNLIDQKKEIESIKKIRFDLELSDADIKSIFEKTGTYNLSVETLLENFIGDLIDGTYSNGSDERMYAQEWFERCHFTCMYNKTFLTYILDHDLLEYILDLNDDVETSKEEIKYLKNEADSDKELNHTEEIKGWQSDLESSQNDLSSCYETYKKWALDDARNYEEEMKDVMEWVKKRNEKINCSINM